MPTAITVYGTLRAGERNSHLVADALSSAPCTIPGRLMDTGYGFPAIVLDETAATVGEVLEIDRNTFARVDRLEGYPNLYDRRQVNVELASGRKVKAWVYVMNNLPPHASVIDSGDWKAR